MSGFCQFQENSRLKFFFLKFLINFLARFRKASYNLSNTHETYNMMIDDRTNSKAGNELGHRLTEDELRITEIEEVQNSELSTFRLLSVSRCRGSG